MSLSQKRAAFALVCLIVVFSALVSGSIYHWSALFTGAALIVCFFMSLPGDSLPALAALWPAWLYTGLLYISALWTANLNATISQAFFFTVFALMAFIAAYSAGGERARTFLKAVVIVSAVVSLYGIYQYFAGFARTEEYVRAYGASEFGLGPGRVASALRTIGLRRAFSTLLSPNVLACYLAMAAPAGLHLAAGTSSPAKKAAYLSVLAFMLVALALTKSVGGIVAMFAGMLAYAFCAYASGMMRLRRALGMLAVIAVVAALAGGMTLAKRTGGFGGVGRSYSERLNYFGGALEAFGEAPIRGNGAGSFPLTYFASIKPGSDETRYAHNVVLQTLSETGLVGLAALLVLFGAFFARCWSGMRRAGPGSVFPALFAGGAAFAVHNMVDFTFYVHDTAVLFWVYFGLAASVSRPDGFVTDARARTAVKVFAAASVAVFCWFFAMAALAGNNESGAVDVLRAYGIDSAGAARSNPAPEEAVALAEKAVTMKPYDDSYLAFLGYLYEGSAYSNGPEYALKAKDAYEKAISLNPMYPFHYRDLGILYMKLGRKAEAADSFRRALGLYPADRQLARLLADAEK